MQTNVLKYHMYLIQGFAVSRREAVHDRGSNKEKTES